MKRYTRPRFPQWRFLPIVILLFLMAACTKAIRPDPAPSHGISVEQILLRYQSQNEIRPPLKGLMKIVLNDKLSNSFWAKWSSHADTVDIEGFNILGGTLFYLHLSNAEVSFTPVQKGRKFNGSREAFRQYLQKESPSGMKIEWLMLFDWVARGGLPDLSLPDRPALAPYKDQLFLNFFSRDEKRDKAVLIQRLLIHPKSFQVQEATFFDPSGQVQARMIFDDYRRIDPMTFPFLIEIEVGRFRGKIIFKELKVEKRESS